MPRVVRQPRNSVQDRPGALKLLLRRQRRFLRPAAFLAAGALVVIMLGVGARAGSDALSGMRERIGDIGAAVGMRVATIEIEGRQNTPEPLLRAAIGVTKGDPILGFSVAAARSRVESLAWVETATVERRLPDTIIVQLVERRPFAIWQNNGKFSLIDRGGQIVADQDVAQFKNLPLVVGAGAPAVAASLLDALRDRPAILSHVAAATRIGERRWNLLLNNGGNVLLPEGAEIAALDRLAALQQEHAVLDRPLQAIDMRLPDRLTIRPQGTPGTTQGSPDSKPADQNRPT